MAPSSKSAPNLGQIIEYLPDRLYLASYLNPPDANTIFPFPEPPLSLKSPSKRSAHRSAAQGGPVSVAARPAHKQPFYFTVDDSLLYNAFHHDFGPLHAGHLYRFALYFHDVLALKENKERPIVFWSKADPRSRANAACLMACYMVLIQSWPPHLALAPIAQADPPLMPFRDAGYSQADYGITVQDVVYGVWKAKEEGCCSLDTFDLEEYERFERVEHGDFNWITPNFLAFASPQHSPVARITEASELFQSLPRTLDALDAHEKLPQPFKNVLRHFSERNIGLVVRLNSALYSPSYFEALGIQHLDMIFEDGTCPPLTMVRKFIRLAHEMITVRKKNIAVHCKAGLGRTGCLIGAYLIYRHGFTANEIIAYMRFMRPGMVVGPQQHWLHINQSIFREWWVEERMERRLRRELAAAAAAAGNIPSTPIRAMQKANLGGRSAQQMSTPPNRSASGRTPLSEIDQERTNAAAQEDYLPAPTPGQPRKGIRTADRHHPYSRTPSGSHHQQQTVLEEKVEAVATTAGGATIRIEQETEVISTVQRSSRGSANVESDEEIHLRMRLQRKAAAAAAAASPERHERRSPSRSASHNTAAAAAAAYTQYIDNDASRDAENIGAAIGRAKALQQHDQRASSASSGVLPKVRGADRGLGGSTGSSRRAAAIAAAGGSVAASAGIRKTSGRIGSVGSAAARKISGLQ